MKFSSSTFRRAAASGALLVSAVSLPLSAQTTAATGPYGVMSLAVARGDRGLAFPLPAENLVVALAAGNAGDAIALTESSVDPRPALASAEACYVEVLTGALEGERFEVDLAATAAGDGTTLVLRLEPGASGTMAALPANALAGARLAVRPHVTLVDLQAMISPALAGSNSPGQADGVQLFEDGTWVRYHLRADRETWVRSGETADVRHRVIPPDVSVILDLKSGGAKRWLHHGVVRTNSFRKNLVAGPQAYATGFPQNLSPIEVGAFVDSGAPVASRWTGANDFEQADSFERQAVSGSMAANRYYLEADGFTWRRVNNATDVAHQPILGATDAFVLKRNNPDEGYLVPVPFEL